jgi:glycosyltransferase involved in cell wall biosynthesis
MIRRTLVVSAVNFTEGGPLTILRDSLSTATETLGSDWRIIALVHDCALVTVPGVEAIAFPRSKSSWLRRIALEWHQFATLSRRLRPDLWLSLHDITPRVTARRQAVYCHNPSPFYEPTLTEAWYDPGFFAFNKLYLALYRILIGRNYAVVVQQEWLRGELGRYHDNVVVAHPGTAATAPLTSVGKALRQPDRAAPLRLLYPALPRVFKNIETICAAVSGLPETLRERIELRLTMDGSEGRWARELRRRYRDSGSIRFIGRQDRAGMTAEYLGCDMVLFPSRLETWGLPISEAKAFGKPILAADLPYAHEAVGTYTGVSFVDALDPAAWKAAIAEAAEGRWKPQAHRGAAPAGRFFPDWPSLWNYLIEGL